jgi:hypothetical protein
VLKEEQRNYDAQKRLRGGRPFMQRYSGIHLSSAFKHHTIIRGYEGEQVLVRLPDRRFAYD